MDRLTLIAEAVLLFMGMFLPFYFLAFMIG
jgi:hypothetical protein